VVLAINLLQQMSIWQAVSSNKVPAMDKPRQTILLCHSPVMFFPSPLAKTCAGTGCHADGEISKLNSGVAVFSSILQLEEGQAESAQLQMRSRRDTWRAEARN
jgi:hypothetical protein